MPKIGWQSYLHGKMNLNISKFSMEACPQKKYELVVQERKDTSFHIMSQKDQTFERKLNFDQVSKQTRTENFHFLGFFKTNRYVEA
jgi:hypothetical protein